MSIESVMPSNHLILCHPFLLLLSIFPSTGVFSNESAQGLDSSNCRDLKQGHTRWDPVPTLLPIHTDTKVWIPSRENTLKGTSRGLRSKQTSKHLGMEER